MGQAQSADEALGHNDHTPYSAAAAGQARNIPAPVQTGQQQDKQQQRSSQQQQQQQSGQQQQQSSPNASSTPQQPSSTGGGGGVSRTDSGNDFAMSIADGAASPSAQHGGGGGGGNGQGVSAAASAAQQPQQSSTPQQQSPHTQGHERNVHEGMLMSPTPSPPKIETVPTAFKWVHGGSEVYVTGSFNNWQGKILMYPNEDSEFTLLIDIPPGTHHYKYIVDSEWRLDEDAPTIQIASVWNNVVEVKRPVFEYTPSTFADSDDEEGGDDRKAKNAAYSQRAPLSNDYVNDPPKLPPHLTDILLNQTQPQDPAMLPVPQHVQLNHVYLMSPAQTDPSILVTGITQRFKPNPHTKITHKFVTTVYYSPALRSDSVSSGPPGFVQQIVVRLPSNPAGLVVDAPPDTQVAQLKAMIQQRANVPINEQIIVFDGRALEDGELILALGPPPVTVQLVLRMQQAAS